jgi:hypothetical protein
VYLDFAINILYSVRQLCGQVDEVGGGGQKGGGRRLARQVIVVLGILGEERSVPGQGGKGRGPGGGRFLEELLEPGPSRT